MGIYGIVVLSVFQALFLISSFDFNVRYCGIIQFCGMWFFILLANGIQ